LRWQLIENNEDTKSLFKYFNTQVGKTFTTNTKDESLNAAFQLILGGYIYFIVLPKLNKKFISNDLTSEITWENFDAAIAKRMELFNKL
jgi:hypothetical protein